MEEYVPPEFVETREPAFWPTFTWVVGVHVVLLALVWVASFFLKPKPQEGITWLDGGGLVGSGGPAGDPAPVPAPPPEPDPEPPAPEPEPVTAPEPPAPAPPPPAPVEEIAVPKPPEPPQPVPPPPPKVTPKPTPPPKPKPEKPKETPKPGAKKPEQKKPVAKLATPKPQAAKDSKTASAQAGEKNSARRDSTGANSKPTTSTKPGPGNAEHEGTKGGPGAKGGSATGALSAAQFGTYFNSVGAKFKEVWNQPLTTEATGQDLTATVHIRVSADGTVLSAVMEKGTGNREVDASIEAAIPKFKKVPAPPAALLKGGVMDERMAVIYDL